MRDIANSEFILGGQRCGMSRRAELLARQWLAQSGRRATILSILALKNALTLGFSSRARGGRTV